MYQKGAHKREERCRQSSRLADLACPAQNQHAGPPHVESELEHAMAPRTSTVPHPELARIVLLESCPSERELTVFIAFFA
jgi:hypothetical protein